MVPRVGCSSPSSTLQERGLAAARGADQGDEGAESPMVSDTFSSTIWSPYSFQTLSTIDHDALPSSDHGKTPDAQQIERGRW